MVGLGDILGLLDRWDEWKRMKAAPARIDALEAEVAALKATLKAKPGDTRPVCPACGEGRMAVTKDEVSKGPFGALGVKDVTRTCTSCAHVSSELVTTT